MRVKFQARKGAGFTMIEIALSIAIVAFALVAIMGVLPSGMQVKKDNREDMVVNEDAAFFMESIRSGARGMDFLTNFVDFVSVDAADVDRVTGITNVVASNLKYTNFLSRVTFPGLGSTNIDLGPGAQIIGRLSVPHMTVSPRGSNFFRMVTNVAVFRGINSGSLDQGRASRDFSFRYKLTSELVPYSPMPHPFVSTNDFLVHKNMTANMYELRLTMQWPVYQRGNTLAFGRNRKTFRTILSGNPVMIFGSDKTDYFFFQPNSFVLANANTP
jgi:type II secretory pathway pseudopilin PulG